MRMELRRLVYARKACICDVPVYACQDCSTYELMPLIKRDLVSYIGSLGEVRRRVRVSFADINEPASVLRDVLSSYSDSLQEFQQRYKAAFDDRIDMLLDLYRFAKVKDDSVWMMEISERLEKVIAFLHLKVDNSDFCAR